MKVVSGEHSLTHRSSSIKKTFEKFTALYDILYYKLHPQMKTFINGGYIERIYIILQRLLNFLY